MVTTVDDYDLWEVEEAVANTVTQASFYAHRHIKRSPYSTLFIQELNRILANVVRQFKARTVSKEQALARIGETYRSLGEQKRQLVIYGADYITDAMLSRGVGCHSVQSFCFMASSAQRHPKNGQNNNIEHRGGAVDRGGIADRGWQHSHNARRFLLFNYVAQAQLKIRSEAYYRSDEARERYYQQIIETSPVVMTPVVEEPRQPLSLKERVAKQRLENHRASEEAWRRTQTAERPPAKPPKKTSLANRMTGGLKQLANDFLGSQRALLAEHLMEKNVLKFKDTQSGEWLSSEEVTERYRNAPTFDIAPLEESGAEGVKNLPNYSAMLLVAETVATRGRNIATDPKQLAREVSAAVKDARSSAEALGQLGGQHALKKLDVKPSQEFVNRYHGPDFIGVDKNNRLTEVEFKGYSGNSTQLASNKNGFKQGSNEKNKARAELMGKKKKKIGEVSGRQGGEYKKDELALWNTVKRTRGEKQHLASFTNTNDGTVKVFTQDSSGNLSEKIFEEKIPGFKEKKQLIEDYYKSGSK